MPEILLSPRQLAERLGISLRTLERMRNTGSGPPFNRVSGGLRRGRVMYRESAVAAWLEARQCRSTVSRLGDLIAGVDAKTTGPRRSTSDLGLAGSEVA